MVRDMRNADMLRKADADTRVCMQDSIRMLVTQGVRDNDYISKWAASTCSIAMRATASVIKDFPTDTVDAMLIAMAYDEMLKIPGLVQPPKKQPKATPRSRD